MWLPTVIRRPASPLCGCIDGPNTWTSHRQKEHASKTHPRYLTYPIANQRFGRNFS